MDRSKVERNSTSKINYKFQDNTEILKNIDIKKRKLNSDVKKYNCQPLIDELNNSIEEDFIIFETPERASFFIDHPNFKIFKHEKLDEKIFRERAKSINENDEYDFKLFAYDVKIQDNKPEKLSPYEEEPELIETGKNKGKWFRYFQIDLPSKQFSTIYDLAKDIKDGREIDGCYISDLHFLFYKNSKQRSIAGALRNGGFCFMSQLDYTVPGGNAIEVDDFLNNLIKNFKENWNDLHPIEKAVALHNEIVALQPFNDGNKRVARLILNSCLLENGYPTIVSRNIDSKFYISAIKDAALYQDGQKMFDLVIKQIDKRIDDYQRYVNDYAQSNCQK